MILNVFKDVGKDRLGNTIFFAIEIDWFFMLVEFARSSEWLKQYEIIDNNRLSFYKQHQVFLPSRF